MEEGDLFFKPVSKSLTATTTTVQCFFNYVLVDIFNIQCSHQPAVLMKQNKASLHVYKIKFREVEIVYNCFILLILFSFSPSVFLPLSIYILNDVLRFPS